VRRGKVQDFSIGRGRLHWMMIDVGGPTAEPGMELARMGCPDEGRRGGTHSKMVTLQESRLGFHTAHCALIAQSFRELAGCISTWDQPHPVCFRTHKYYWQEMSERRGGIDHTPPGVNLYLSLPFQWIAESGFLPAEACQHHAETTAQKGKSGRFRNRSDIPQLHYAELGARTNVGAAKSSQR